MTPKQVIKHFKGVNNTATALGIKPPSVSEWISTGKIPRLRQYQIQQLTAGKLKAEHAA